MCSNYYFFITSSESELDNVIREIVKSEEIDITDATDGGSVYIGRDTRYIIDELVSLQRLRLRLMYYYVTYRISNLNNLEVAVHHCVRP